MNYAVTGGSGFFGEALVRALRARKDRVRALVRREAAERRLRALGAEPLRGDLTEPGVGEGLVERGDVLIHAAARVELTGRWEQFDQTTIAGTRRLLATVLPQRPGRFVYISSEAVYAPEAGGGVLAADRTPTRPATYNYYGRAKLAAERLVRAACEAAGCPWTILRLGVLYGPRNVAFCRHFRTVAENGNLRIIGDGENRIATLYVDDAVGATLAAAASPPAAGRIYDVASDEPVTQRRFVEAHCEALGLPPPRGTIGQRPAMTAAWLIERLGQWFERDVHISRAAVALMSADQVIDAGPLRAELGWRARTRFAEGMERMRRWYRESVVPSRGAGRGPRPAETGVR